MSKLIFSSYRKNLFLFVSGIFAVLIFAFPAFSQNKFEGYNIILDVPRTQKQMACALRYSPPTSAVTISDLNPSTPFKLQTCDGKPIASATGSTASINASSTNFKWCFVGEDKKYRISFDGDSFSGRQVYDWIATPDEKNLGFYNVKDFGAVGDGKTDDTIAIQSALAFIGTRAGGVLNFPEGDYLVGTIPNYKGIVVPSGTTIQGVSGLHSDAIVNNVIKRSATRITLRGTNRPIFLLGECVEKVVFKDIELYGESTDNTYGIEAVGAYISTQDVYIERVSFTHFFHGIHAYGLPQTNQQWQFDFIKINHSRFMFNKDAGIYCDVWNTDWKVEGSFFFTPKNEPGTNADAMNFVRFGMLLVQDTFGGGFYNNDGGTFIKAGEPGMLTIIGSEVEQIKNSIVINPDKNPHGGNYSYPVTVMNSFLGPPIVINSRRTYVSVGNGYNPRTFTAGENVRIYSLGDRFCYDGYLWGCDRGDGGKERLSNQNVFDKATVVFMSGQPAEGSVPGIPTIFGTDVQFNTPVQMPSIQADKLPLNKPNGSMVFCSNCRRSTTPCQAGGTGAPAMVIGNQWSCM